ncbi:MauE/DoxX family redox-associated membrane protein [Roseibacillus ishigakijimensis]|uniref:DoxX family membrane protein n=1 Tax=Roseibacillus ishigakijimensis TaxID=454146 RepID=A0A934VGL1_9BACT|nr:DoxX family membrane protein [Roseibacillus ishigakijimensis]
MSHLSRIALGLFFLVTGVLKLRDLNAFTEDVFNYQILFPPFDAYTALLVVWLEIIAGLVVLVGRWGLRGGLVTIGGLLLAFIAALSHAAARGLNINCGCFGSSEEPTNFPLHLGLNALLLLLTLLLLRHSSTPAKGQVFGPGKLHLPEE